MERELNNSKEEEQVRAGDDNSSRVGAVDQGYASLGYSSLNSILSVAGWGVAQVTGWLGKEVDT